MLKYSEYPAEIERVKQIINKTHSRYMKQNMQKYLKRLRREKEEYENIYGRSAREVSRWLAERK